MAFESFGNRSPKGKRDRSRSPRAFLAKFGIQAQLYPTYPLDKGQVDSKKSATPLMKGTKDERVTDILSKESPIFSDAIDKFDNRSFSFLIFKV